MAIRHSLAAAALLLGTVPVAAETVTAKDPQSIVQAMQAAGYQAKLDVDKVGDPMVKSSTSGTQFGVYFYNCTDHKDCTSIQFQTGFDTDPGKAPSLEVINRWNTTKRYTAAYLDDEGDPGISMDVNLDHGGIASDLFEDNLQLWASLVADYEKHIGW
jgi:hypothetical protein